MISKPENFEQVGYISSKGILIRRMEKLMKWLETSDALTARRNRKPSSSRRRPRPRRSADFGAARRL
jgi:hypothetical protein